MSQVVTIYGKKYPVKLSYKCLDLLTEMLGFNSPVSAVKKVSEVFQPLFEAYADVDENEFDQIDTEKIDSAQLEMFRMLTICAIQAADPKSDFNISEDDTFKFFISNASELGTIITGFVKANFIQDNEPGKQKRTKKSPKS